MAGEDEEGSLCPFEAASEQKVLVGTSRDALGSPGLIYMGAGSMGRELLRLELPGGCCAAYKWFLRLLWPE